MESPSALQTGKTTLESFKVTSGDELSYPDFNSRSQHPYSPWGPTTKFYVSFTIRPIRQFLFKNQRPHAYALPTAHLGLVLARPHDDRGNLCIWQGQMLDVLPSVAGISFQLAKFISKTVHDRILEITPKLKEIVKIKVEMDVVTQIYIRSDDALDRVSDPVVSGSLDGGDCGVCSEPLLREVVVRRAACSHCFHSLCLASRACLVCPVCCFEFGSVQDIDVNRSRGNKREWMQQMRDRASNNMNMREENVSKQGIPQGKRAMSSSGLNIPNNHIP